MTTYMVSCFLFYVYMYCVYIFVCNGFHVGLMLLSFSRIEPKLSLLDTFADQRPFHKGNNSQEVMNC